MPGYGYFNENDPYKKELVSGESVLSIIDLSAGKTNKQFSSDGHPQHNEFNDKIVTDTYPNRSRIQELSVYDIKSDNKKTITKLWSPSKFRDEYKCDLHPRRARTTRVYEACYFKIPMISLLGTQDFNFVEEIGSW